ncbi:MAG: acyltransferase [Lachnospiraceae bacterium]
MRELHEDKKDASVELMRIVACITVIATHIKLRDFVCLDGTINKSQIFLASFAGTEGVAVFFMIAGFFMFRSNSFKKMISRCVKSIILPSLVYVILLCFLGEWISGRQNVLISIKTGIQYIKPTIIGILNWDANAFMHGGHLWYIFTYIQCMLWFPLLKYVCTELDKNAIKVRRYIMIMAILNICINDLKKIFTSGIVTVTAYTIVSIALFEMLWGYELYTNIRGKCLNNRVIRVVVFFLYFVLHYVNYLIGLYLFQVTDGTTWGFAWNNLVYILSATCLIIFFFTFDFKHKKIINFISSCTFYIYIIHYALVVKFETSGWHSRIVDYFIMKNDNIFGEIGYTVGYTLIIFILSFLISEIIMELQAIIGLLKKKISRG